MTEPSPTVPNGFTGADVPALVTTARLRLRPFAASDAAALQRIVLANLDHIGRWMEWATAERHADLDVIARRLAGFAASFAAGREWAFVIERTEDDAFIGAIGVHPRVGVGGLEIGYWLAADATGRGYVTEAVRALLDVAFTRMHAERVEIRCDPANVRSAAVPQRLGFRHVTTLIANAVTPTGAPRDTMVWELTRDEHLAAASACA
jgi:RimJ/RimL family protein N-acetyltransferase